MSMLKKDRSTLEQLINYFGVGGRIRELDKNNLRFYIESLQDLTAVISHFDTYPLFTKKHEDYLLFKHAFDIVKNKNHLTMEGLRQVVGIKASLRNKGLSDNLMEAFPGIIPSIVPVTNSTSGLAGIDKSIIYPWLAGFTSGDGCFYISITESEKRVQVQLVFSITQHIRDQALMNSLISYLGCGNIKHHEKYSWLQFIVTKFSDINENIIPIFIENKILGDKFKDFQDWCRVAELMKNKAHLTTDGLEEIRKLKGGMNTGRSVLLPVSNQVILNKAKLPQGKRYYSSDSNLYPVPYNIILKSLKEGEATLVFEHGKWLEDKLWDYLYECMNEYLDYGYSSFNKDIFFEFIFYIYNKKDEKIEIFRINFTPMLVITAGDSAKKFTITIKKVLYYQADSYAFNHPGYYVDKKYWIELVIHAKTFPENSWPKRPPQG